MTVDRYQNSTAYEHPQESNLLNIHKTMQYNSQGQPVARVHVDGISLEGDVIVDTVSLSSSTLAALESVNVQNTVTVTVNNFPTTSTVYQGTIPWATTITNWPALQYVNGTLYAVQSGTWNVNVTSLPAVSGTVAVSSLPAITGTVIVSNFTSTVRVDNFPTSITVTNFTSTVFVSNTLTISNTSFAVTNFPTTSTVYQGTSPWNITGTVNIGTMPEVEIKNDAGNPVPISANTSSNSSGNPVYVSATISNTDPITVAQSDIAVTAFDEPIAVGITPVIQADAQYGLDPDFWIQSKLNGGNIVIDEYNTWQVSSGTSPGGYARLATAKYMSYQSGQGSLFRWTAAFTASGTTKAALGVDAIVQNTGPIDREDGYSFGYSGSTANDASRKIGILHRRNGKTEIRKLTITMAPTGNQTATVTVDGVAYTVAITAGDVNHCANELATGLKAITVLANTWDIEGCNGIITFTYYSPGAKGGTYSFSSSGAGTLALGTFSQIQAGATPSDTWTYVDDWDNQTIQFDPTKLNVYQIDMRWLGAGRVRFFMEDPSTGKMVLVHTQRWTSQQVYPHINKPSLRIAYRSGTTNPAVTPSQNVIVRGSSIVCAVQGVRTQTGSSQGRYNISATTRAKDLVWHLMSIQNPYVRNGGVNKASLMMQTLTVAAQGNDPSAIYIVKDAFGASNVLSYIAIPNTTSAMFAQYSISEVTIDLSTQRIANVQTLGINDNATFDLASYNLTLSPGETISVFISSSNSLTRTAVGLTWLVD
jgi:hypothetical protein